MVEGVPCPKAVGENKVKTEKNAMRKQIVAFFRRSPETEKLYIFFIILSIWFLVYFNLYNF
jgi:hypothetical protein